MLVSCRPCSANMAFSAVLLQSVGAYDFTAALRCHDHAMTSQVCSRTLQYITFLEEPWDDVLLRKTSFQTMQDVHVRFQRASHSELLYVECLSWCK